MWIYLECASWKSIHNTNIKEMTLHAFDNFQIKAYISTLNTEDYESLKHCNKSLIRN